jgi:FAD-dependent monooxygenase
MNTGLGDAYDVAWKIAMVLKGAGGEDLLDSYEAERRPVAIRNVQRAAEHMGIHQHYTAKALQAGPEIMLGGSKGSEEIKAYLKKYVDTNDGENKDYGIEMDYRLRPSPVIATEGGVKEPEWRRQAYFPSTFPGSRAPHVFLANSMTSIYDLLGKEYTAVDFSQTGSLSLRLEQLAKAEGVPLTRLHLPNEKVVSKVWVSDLVLVRPDHFVAWRSSSNTAYSDGQLRAVLAQVFGRGSSDPSSRISKRYEIKGEKLAFEGVDKLFNQDAEKVESLAAFQS